MGNTQDSPVFGIVTVVHVVSVVVVVVISGTVLVTVVLNGAAAKIAAATTTAVTTIAATKAGMPTAVLRCIMSWLWKCPFLINSFVRVKLVRVWLDVCVI